MDERRFRRRDQEQPQVERDEFGRVGASGRGIDLPFAHGRSRLAGQYMADDVDLMQRKWPEEKVFVGLDPIPGFNLRAQIVGSGGSYVKHIQSETGSRVQIKGRGSGYLEVATNRECDEDLHLHVTYVTLPQFWLLAC